MKLTKLQQNILKVLGQTKLADYFYWTGGTLLSSHYLQHRYSEDLDFFSYNLIPEESVLALIQKIKTELKLTRIKQVVNMNRQQYQIYKGKEVMNLEFVYFPFKQLKKQIIIKEYQFGADSLLDIAVNKVFALYGRGEPKDVFDIYTIYQSKRWTVSRLLKLVIKKFGVEIDQALLSAKALEANDKLKSIQPLFSKKTNVVKLQRNIESLFLASGKRHLASLLV